MQIIPAIDIRGGRCVRLVQGDYERETVFAEDPVSMARRWVDEGARRLHLVDLDGAREGRPVNADVVQRIVGSVGVPCQFGGGLRDDASLAVMLEQAGVERAIVGTQALKQPEWFRDAVARWPGRIVLGLDARDSRVATDGWLDVSQVPALELAKSYARLPLAAIIYTNIANDGMLAGVDDSTFGDLEALAELGLPVLASGGVTSVDDVARLAEIHRRQPRLAGAIVGRALYEGTLKLADALAASTGFRPSQS
ncbi:MAG: 1-(5-phosphoribosyl)-5-[(5-phosphoribosylamino)methylideneamino]imidazole-4-carboxamide isomerase [Planctomycetes bacterium]|nr:1-(5-phosphoribosyl)-5-[(5-phosphoribosylamino)methylideneamino]imidazole-4-carboxamide isomerase [Planctomycetota bacterium]